MFVWCWSYPKNITIKLDMTNVTNASNMFDCTYSLTTLDMSGCDVSNVTDFGSDFIYNGSYYLTTVKAPKNISVSIKFDSNKLTHDSLMSIINNLATVSTTQTLTLGSTNLNKLTDDEKAIATNKGWTLK